MACSDCGDGIQVRDASVSAECAKIKNKGGSYGRRRFTSQCLDVVAAAKKWKGAMTRGVWQRQRQHEGPQHTEGAVNFQDNV
jgi:hypothetical protein